MRPPREDTEPWYKQFWPWFLISFPLAAVIGGIVTIIIAVKTDDGLVTDNYYKKGLAIHKNADSYAKAKALGIAATVTYEEDTGALNVQMDKPLVEPTPALLLSIVHPTVPNQDQAIRLVTAGNNLYVGKADTLSAANWKLSLSGNDREWRIDGRLKIPGNRQAELK